MNSYVEFPALGIKFALDRVAFTIGSKPVYWYGIIITLGLLLGVYMAVFLGKKRGVSSDTVFDIVLWGLPSAIVCARLYYVLFEFEQYKDNLWDVFKIWEGGIAIYGAVIGAVLAAYIYCRVKKLDFLQIADVCCVGLITGQAIGRWGNFTNQEAFGVNTAMPWGMTGSDITEKLEQMKNAGMNVSPDMPVHPTFLYESLWNLAVLIVLVFVFYKFYKFNGQIFLSYISLYGLGRLWIEGLRTDSLYLGIFRISQLVAFVCVVFGVVLLIKGFKSVPKNTDFEKNIEKIEI